MRKHDPLSASGLSRRDLLQLGAGGIGLGLAGGLGTVPSVLAQASKSVSANPTARIPVVFGWFGGNDGLNTIVPYGDPLYSKHRPTIRSREPDLLQSDAQLGCHKALRARKTRYDDGQAA